MSEETETNRQVKANVEANGAEEQYKHKKSFTPRVMRELNEREAAIEAGEGSQFRRAENLREVITEEKNNADGKVR